MPIQLSMFYNLGSIILGVAAWIFAGLAIANQKKGHQFSIISYSACAFSLLFQLLEVGNRVNLGDYAAIEDTIRAVLFASFTLVVVTFALNVVALVKSRSSKMKKH